MVCIIRRGALWAPAGGHMGPPLQILTNIDGNTSSVTAFGRATFPPGGRFVAPYANGPFPSVGAAVPKFSILHSQFSIPNS